MLAEMINSIVGLAAKGQGFKTLNLPGDREQLIRQPDGTIVRETIPNPDRKYLVGDIESFVQMLDEADQAIVFVSPRGPGELVQVTAFYDESERRDFVDWTISPSAALVALLSLGTWNKQKHVVELIRDRLFESVPTGLLAQLRSIDFSRRNDGSRTIEHGRESLGRSVEMAVQSKQGELPEVFEVSLPWYSTSPVSEAWYRLSVTLDLDAANESIRLVIRGDGLDVANQQALKMARQFVDEQLNAGGGAIPVVIGQSR